MSRGQALVEFALILPILALLLVMAIDFGRVFFGWVSLTNAARIGANFAGYTPDLLDDPADRDDYEALIFDHVTGCALNPADPNDAAYDPTFSDANGDDDGVNQDWGDLVTVTISCDVELITPLAGAIVGQVVPMAAEAVFPIREGTFAGPTGGGAPPNPPCTLSRIPDLKNRTLLGARTKWVGESFLPEKLTFEPSTATDDWIVTDPITFTPNAVINECVDPTGQAVHLTMVAPPPCPAGFAQVPDLIGDLVSAAKVEWSGSFSGAFKPNNAVDSKTVLTQTTDPSTPINACAPTTAEVTVTWGDPPPVPCDVPLMVGLTEAQAIDAWVAAKFTTTLEVKKQGQSPDTVFQQQPTHPGTVSCGVKGEVRLD